jgi:hypothetical protein
MSKLSMEKAKWAKTSVAKTKIYFFLPANFRDPYELFIFFSRKCKGLVFHFIENAKDFKYHIISRTLVDLILPSKILLITRLLP